VSESVGTQVGFEETRSVAIPSSEATRGSQVVPQPAQGTPSVWEISHVSVKQRLCSLEGLHLEGEIFPCLWRKPDSVEESLLLEGNLLVGFVAPVGIQ